MTKGSPRSLKEISQIAPVEDRRDTALKPTSVPFKRPSGTRYVSAFNPHPRTLDELRVSCEPHGDAAVAEAQWNAVSMWLMWCSETTIKMPVSAAFDAISVSQVADRDRLEYPGLSSTGCNPGFAEIPPATQTEPRRVANAIVELWENTDRPYLLNSIAKTHQTVVRYIRIGAANPLKSQPTT